jgi:hypothetical protein
MTMKIFLLLVAIALAGTAVAQTGERGSTPPGMSQDGAKPADGAIKGGAIVPGESAGVPQKTPSRCNELEGTLREDCLKREREAAGGATKDPSDSRKRSPERAD